MKMHELPNDRRKSYKIRIPFGITGDPAAASLPRDYYTLKYRNRKDSVRFRDGLSGRKMKLEETGDMRSDRYAGPPGYEGMANIDSFWDAPGGAPMRSREVDFIPMNDAFSTIPSVAPFRRIGENCKSQSGLIYNGTRPTNAYGYFRDQDMRGCITQCAPQCCGYGIPGANLPFPRENFQASHPPYGH